MATLQVEYQNLVACFVAHEEVPAGQELNIAYIDTEMPRTSRIQVQYLEGGGCFAFRYVNGTQSSRHHARNACAHIY